METIDRDDVIAALRAGRLLRTRDVRITCETAFPNRARDVIELYLLLSRVKDWSWVDFLGAVSHRQSAARILWNLAADAARWPFYFWGIRNEVRRLEQNVAGAGPRPIDPENRSMLFIRSDHWFNAQSGGDVGHQVGVNRGFREHGHQVHVASTDFLPGVPQDDHFHRYPPAYEAGRNLPTIPQFLPR